MPSRTAPNCPTCQVLSRKVRDMERARQLDEAKMQEQRDIINDLMPAIGVRETCSKCGLAIFWVRLHGCGNARAYNPDGTEHWPRCRGTARPSESLAISS